MKKKLQKSLIMIIMILSMLALAACSKSDEDDEESGSRRRRTENVEPTDDPDVTAEPTAEPTTTPEPTIEPTAEPTAEITIAPPVSHADDEKKEGDNGDEPATGEPDPTGEIEPTPVVTGEPDDDNTFVFEVKYVGYTDVDDKAKEVAETFGNAFVFGDKEVILNTIAYDEERKADLDEELGEYQGLTEMLVEELSEFDLGLSNADVATLISLECVGGKKFDKETAVYNLILSDTYITDPMAWDNYHVISTEMKGDVLSYIGNPLGGGINFIVAERDGEYKALTVAFYDEDEGGDEPVDPETDAEKLIEIKGRLYQFNGNETTDEIIDMFNKAFEDFDFYTMISCVAIDDGFYIDAIADNEDAIAAFELYKLAAGTMTISTSRGEAVEVSEEELNDVRRECETVDNPETITDVVKYEVTYHMEMAGETQDQVETVYVGKYNGENRIVHCFIFN